MLSRILIKLLDQAILPAVVLLSWRMISIVLLARYMRIPFTLEATGFVFGSPADYIRINSLSTFSLIILTFLGVLYVLVKAYAFHNSHVKPSMTAHLFTLNLEFFIQSSFEIYTQGAVWLSYMFLLTIAAGVFGVLGMMLPWVFAAGLVLSILVSVLFALDIENEMVIAQCKEEVYDEDELYLEKEGTI